MDNGGGGLGLSQEPAGVVLMSLLSQAEGMSWTKKSDMTYWGPFLGLMQEENLVTQTTKDSFLLWHSFSN